MLVYDIALTLIPEIGNIRGRKLIEVFGSAETALKTALPDIAEQTEIPYTAIKNMEINSVFPEAEAEIRYMEKHGIKAIPIGSDSYPQRLKECPDAPLVLYVRGNIDFNTPHWLSVVGTRKSTSYGKTMTRKLIDGLHELLPKTVIVSGLAYGTDIEAHLTALHNGMRTVAVLGNPLGYTYPESHTEYAEQIVQRGGALVSEFHSRHALQGANFLRRNRIIAGLSEGTLVIESARRGGSLSTANYAHGYYRDVMAIPGKIGDLMSEGTNRLIRTNKAAMVLSPQDILDHLNWDSALSRKENEEEQPELFIPSNPEEQLIYTAVCSSGVISVDDLCAKTGLPAQQISSHTLTMELNGLIRRNPGNMLEKI